MKTLEFETEFNVEVEGEQSLWQSMDCRHKIRGRKVSFRRLLKRPFSVPSLQTLLCVFRLVYDEVTYDVTRMILPCVSIIFSCH